jgi:F-type H+-transporting ATPase subunit c
MNEPESIIHYGTIVLTVAVNSIAVGIGQGLASSAAIKAMDIQPSAKDDITKTAVLSSALMEGAAIIAIVMAMMLFYDSGKALFSQWADVAKLGIISAICLPGFCIALLSYWPVRSACFSIARQPFFGGKITRMTLITLSVIQTPLILGFIVAMMIKTQALVVTSLPQALRLLGSGIAIGIGSIGPAIGLTTFAATTLRGIGYNRASYNKLFTFTFISQAVIETPLIFALVISLGLLFMGVGDQTVLKGICALAAGIAIGLGTLAPGISSGKTAASAAHQVALRPENYNILSKTSIFAQGIIDTSAIYAFIIAALLVFIL